jgi:polar amino acid transport system substrate-binding protein
MKQRLSGLVRRAAASLFLALLALTWVVYWKQLHPYDPSLIRVQESGVLRVGMDPTYPPFSDFSQGEPVGLDVDLAREIAKRLGVRLQIVPLGIDGLYSALQSGQVDVLISALSFDPTRLADVIYTRPYIDAGAVLASREGDVYLTMPDLEGKTTAVEYGSLGDELARRWVRRLRVLHVTRFVEPDQALAAVVAGKAEAALVDSVSARLYRRTHEGLHIAPQTVYPDTYAVAVPIKGLKLAEAVNAALETMDSDGILTSLLNRWL